VTGGPETERLVLRGWRDEDVEPFAALCSDPRVMRWVGRGVPQDRAQAEVSLAVIRDHWARHGFGLWAAQERATEEFAGFVGLARLDDRSGEVEIGWRLRRESWGRGLATEGALAAREHAFGELGLSRLVAQVHPDKRPSIRVVDKLGMAFERRRTSRHGTPVLVYALAAR
jgi:RimJ/RimL family protein N-acetyltransferase